MTFHFLSKKKKKKKKNMTPHLFGGGEQDLMTGTVWPENVNFMFYIL